MKNSMIDNYNQAHGVSSSLRAKLGSGTLLQNYIQARLTNRQTVRILLDAQYYEE